MLRFIKENEDGNEEILNAKVEEVESIDGNAQYA